MTAAAPRPFHEPAEHDDPRNALLDAAAELIRRCLDHGCEPQLRARLDRLLPAPPQPAPAAGLPDDALPRAIVVAALREARRSVKAASSRAMFDTALAVMAGDADAVARRLADPAATLNQHRKGDPT